MSDEENSSAENELDYDELEENLRNRESELNKSPDPVKVFNLILKINATI